MHGRLSDVVSHSNRPTSERIRSVGVRFLDRGLRMIVDQERDAAYRMVAGHAFVREVAEDYVRRALPTSEEEWVERHCRACMPCRELVDRACANYGVVFGPSQDRAGSFAERQIPDPIKVEPPVVLDGPVDPSAVTIMPPADLGVSERTVRALNRAGIDSVARLLETQPSYFLSLRNVGPRALAELGQSLVALSSRVRRWEQESGRQAGSGQGRAPSGKQRDGGNG